MVSEPRRWAIIGAGGMGRFHVRAVLARQDARLVAACDVNPQALDPLPESVQRLSDWRTLVRTIELDGATVILPHHLYPKVVGALLGQGVHVLKEEPFARNLDDALAMARASGSTGRQLTIAGQHKFRASFALAREHVPELGEIFLTRASILYLSAPIVREGRWAWRGTGATSGGVAIVDSGWHILELLTLLRGIPSRVTAATGAMRVSPGEHDVDEQAALILEYPDGGIATVVSCFTPAPAENRLVLYGKRGTLDCDLLHDQVALYRDGSPVELPPPTPVDPATRMYDLFLESIATGRPGLGDWREALAVQRIIEAAYVSVSRGGSPVGLDEVIYNTHRRHSALGYRSPVDDEGRWQRPAVA